MVIRCGKGNLKGDPRDPLTEKHGNDPDCACSGYNIQINSRKNITMENNLLHFVLL